jgi:hypothetical protein
MPFFKRFKRLIEILCAIAFAGIGLLALSKGGIQFAAGFSVLTVTFAVPLNTWQNTWRQFGGLLRWLLMAIGCFAVSI